jgi:hypothetical protein
MQQAEPCLAHLVSNSQIQQPEVLMLEPCDCAINFHRHKQMYVVLDIHNAQFKTVMALIVVCLDIVMCVGKVWGICACAYCLKLLSHICVRVRVRACMPAAGSANTNARENIMCLGVLHLLTSSGYSVPPLKPGCRSRFDTHHWRT